MESSEQRQLILTFCLQEHEILDKGDGRLCLLPKLFIGVGAHSSSKNELGDGVGEQAELLGSLAHSVQINCVLLDTNQYGPVFTFWFAGLPTVHICDWNLAQEAMIKKGQLFENRITFFLEDCVFRGMGVIFSNGTHWQQQRKFLMQSLRNIGKGTNTMESRIMKEIEYRSERLEDIVSYGGEIEFDPQQMLNLTIGNIINQFMFGKRFTEENENEFFALKKIREDSAETGSALDFMLADWNQNLPIFSDRLKKKLKPEEDIKSFLKEQVKARIESIECGTHVLNEDAPDDFVDAFLVEIKKNKENQKTSFYMESLIQSLYDLWFAGQETTATTLHWALAYLTLNPEVMVKLQEELDTVTQKSRPLSLSDRLNTPFLNAVITETLRVSSIVPINLWRVAAEDVQVGHYSIPKGTTTMAEVSVLMRDPDVFEQPQKFNPNRFLNSPELEQRVAAFSIGKRSCPGESLARNEFYLIIGNLVRRFDFRVSPTKPPGMIAKDEKGTIRRALPYNLIVKNRT